MVAKVIRELKSVSGLGPSRRVVFGDRFRHIKMQVDHSLQKVIKVLLHVSCCKRLG